MPPRGDGYGGRRAQAWVRQVLNTYGTTCHLCGHDQADSSDHLVPRSVDPTLMYVTSNGRPVHHRPCPSCGVRCNIRRKDKALRVAPPVDARAFFDSRP